MTSVTSVPPMPQPTSAPAFKQKTFKQGSIPKPDAIKEHPNYYELTYETEASTGKKWGVGLGSAFLPGLGQAINGQWGKGLGFFAGNIALQTMAVLPMIRGKMPSPIAGIAALGLGIWSIVDAVKNAKNEVKQIVPKGDERLNITA